MKNCNENQIRMYNNDILYCENANCLKSCPVGKTATCLPYYSEDINDINLNICKCYKGWAGDNCDIKQFIDFK